MSYVTENERVSSKRRACVFAASRTGNNAEHVAAARDVGRLVSRLEWDAVYGGGPAGLMGAFADGFLSGGGRLMGVVPEDLYVKERGQTPTGVEIVTTPTIYERKQKMIEGIDLFIALPGGVGTLDELFEVVEMKYHGEINARIALFSPDDFWHKIEELMQTLAQVGYVSARHMQIMERLSNIDELELLMLDVTAYKLQT